MVGNLLYLAALILELCFAIGFSIFTIFLIYSSLKGSPYVPTKQKEIDEILRQTLLKKGQSFYELGCGDGRVVRRARLLYGIKGVGIDVNPILVWYASLLARLQRLTDLVFKRENILNVDLSSAQVIYLFLMPDLLKRLKFKLIKELKPGTMIISHGFKIEGFDKLILKTIDHKPFPTYFYKIS